MTSKKAVTVDDRFSKVKKDPRFWEMPDIERKVKIDKRFQSMFHDKRFQLKYTVDKRGRPVNHSSTEDLKRFYKLSDSEQSDEDEKEEDKTEKTKRKIKKAIQLEADKEAQAEDDDDDERDLSEKSSKKAKKKSKDPEKSKPSTEMPVKGVRVFEEDEDKESGLEEEDDVSVEGGSSEGSDDDDDVDNDDEDESESDEDSDSGPDLARGKGNIETSSDEDEDGEDEVEKYLQREEEEIEHDWGEMWKDAPRTEDTSHRLAVCNMDWDRLKAKDLLALFNSFKPIEGVVLSVTIYPSEYGKERMQAEQTQGPLELTSLPENPDADTEEQRIYREKVRDYQFKRMRYYYAVVECDSAETAAKIYEECDGFEYESSCSTIDLRFIPNYVTFDDEPKDRATDVDYASYKPKLFTSTATTTAKVELTWDETDHDRVMALSRKFNKNELLDMDFKAYLASSSSEEEEEPEKETEVIKPVEFLPEEKNLSKRKKDSDQIEKYRELLRSIQDKDKQKDNNMDMEVTWVPGLKETTEKLVKKKMERKDKLTPWEEYLQRKTEKMKEKRKGKKEVMDAEPEISDDELPADVDLNDPFFTEELCSIQSLKNKKIKKGRIQDEKRTVEEEEVLQRQRAEMELLMDDDEDDKHKHFNYDKIVEQQNLSKKKRKKLLKSNTPLEEDKFQVDVRDSRFQAMFTSHLYNLDPSDPAYKKTKGTQSILEEKQRRREEEQRGQEGALKSKSKPEAACAGDTSSTKVMDPNLSMLIKSIKNKTEQFQARKKQKTK
ncbi:ESF1 homolog [Myxocyprinus asiaticus]|uniref:ESF1 homolog n=1 Tax=Myxocyprinus asiaticus TaxID=70543 RepID=UPI0022227D4C|nr:ESF1 homolog [Myxocyprinus asiaticus]XP_051559168.1 ESF1 homolog [Myxocyprinus asiaticus]XP_051559169.1 ESF1 homolog [Myxocyprinus asiaticus]